MSKMIVSALLMLGASVSFAQMHAENFDFVAPVVTTTTAIPPQTGLILYEVGTGFIGVNSSGGFDQLTPQSNSVTTSSAAEIVERITVTNNGTSCVATRQSGTWVTSLVRSAAGKCDLTIASGIFTGAPTCVTSVTSPSTVGCGLYSDPSTSNVSVQCQTFAGAGTDLNFHLICMGPH